MFLLELKHSAVLAVPIANLRPLLPVSQVCGILNIADFTSHSLRALNVFSNLILTIPCVILQSVPPPKNVHKKDIKHKLVLKTPTYFGIEVPSSGNYNYQGA